ncbi:MAG: ATP-dependent helicase [Desulfovibrio sp.]|jgi:DNA helicase-2/ATP-dependent DNA helicase PcrA|nr:ATP-dependent helicase [Desulfovibrio sp.]
MVDYERDLNEAQLEAVTSLDGPVLVIAGAGSGKTRTIVYRLARLVETGVPASSILLLTFTRKAAREMLERARQLLGYSDLPGLSSAFTGGPFASNFPAQGISSMQGGTFHSYAFSVLRIFRPWDQGRNITVMDSHDILSALQHCREEHKIGKGDRSFPRNQTINALLSKSRNKETPIEEVIRRDAYHLFGHCEAISDLYSAYAIYKKEKNLLDYDDLLFSLEDVLRQRPEALAYCRERHQYVMVDEYQDTNAVQARIVALLAGLGGASGPGGEALFAGQEGGNGESCVGIEREESGRFSGNLMVVGDDAQSIYAFRGANVRNILNFPILCPGVKIIRLEENYRSTQPILDLSNAVLSHASEGYAKRLFTRRGGGKLPCVVRPLSDKSQAAFVAGRILELLHDYKAEDIAVLFRAAFHSFALEALMNKLGLPFRKYGGIRYTDAAHIKDAMSYLRLVHNPLDFTAFHRVSELSRGIGPKTCLKIHQAILNGDLPLLNKEMQRHPDLAADLDLLERLRSGAFTPVELLSEVTEHYAPRLEEHYPDDYPRRMQDLEHLLQIASSYQELDVLLADLSLEDPEKGDETRGGLTFSTIHSAKGLEWEAVLILDLVEERFPSRHASVRPEDFEEERRLMYVACTRARSVLELYVPASIYDRAGSGGSMPAVPSPFVRELSPDLYREFQENYSGGLIEKKSSGADKNFLRSAFSSLPGEKEVRVKSASAVLAARATGEAPAPPDIATCGFCRHRIFGRGKIVQQLPPDRVRVNFPGIGLKVIMSAYLSMED